MIGIDFSGILSGGGPLIKLDLSGGGTYNVKKFPSDIAYPPYLIVFRSINKSNNYISFIFSYFNYFNILWLRFSFFI